jgi:hypothetical protein
MRYTRPAVRLHKSVRASLDCAALNFLNAFHNTG